MALRTTTRRPAIAGAAILAAAFALGLVMDRAPLASARRMAAEHRAYRGIPVSDWVAWSVTLATPPLATLTLAGLALRLFEARRGRLPSRPGAVALVAASVAIGLHLLAKLSRLYLVWGAIGRYDHQYDLWRPLIIPAGTAVAAAWGVLALTGRWAPDSEGIDRAGHWIGGLWLIGLGATILVEYRIFLLPNG